MSTTVLWSPPAQAALVIFPGAIFEFPFDDSTALPIEDALSSTVGLVFDATTHQTIQFSGDLMLDAPVMVSFSLRLRVQSTAPDTGPWQLEVGFVPELDPANYSLTLFPFGRSEVSFGVFDLGTLTPTTQTVTLHCTLRDPLLQLRSTITQRSRWQGKTAWSLRAPATSNRVTVLNGPSWPIEMVTTQERFFAGLTGGGSGKLRAVRDGRYGMPAWNTELVRDGDQQGLFVRPLDSDPEDEQATYRRKSGEGTITDEVPDL